MPLFYIYYILIGISVVGIFYVAWLLKTETGTVNSMRPTLVKKQKYGQPFAGKDAIIKNFFEKKHSDPTKVQVVKNNFSANTSHQNDPEKSNSLMAKLTQDVSFGKNKVNPQDDIPQATTFSDLTIKSSPLQAKHLFTREEKENTPSTGTASLTTAPIVTSKPDPLVVKREQEAADQLKEMKEKYEKLDVLFNEKSQKLANIEGALNNELKNREDFFKLKAILESEIKEVKDRAKELQLALRTARTEIQPQKIQSEQQADSPVNSAIKIDLNKKV